MSVQKQCPSCKDQTGGRPTPHSLRDGKWKCGLCGHETAKRSYTSKKSKDMEALIKRLSEEGEGTGPVNVAANVADPKNKRLFNQPVKRKIPSFKSFMRK